LPEHSPLVEADAAQLHQVLMNLCTNAWQAIGARSGRIEIGVTIRKVYGDDPGIDLPPGEYACLWVTDNGQGMSAAVQERIFEPFFTTKAPGEGTGLGLAVAHGIVRSHHGALRVKSNPSHGSTFTLYLPAAGSEPAEKAEDRDSRPRTRSVPLRVAYVDDEPQVAAVMVRLLERRGFVVRSFASAAEFLADFGRSSDFDVIVTDFNMPRMSGIELARALRDQGVDIGMVLTSGYVSDQLRSAAEEVGITRVVKKPESLDLLCTVIRDAAPTRRATTGFQSTAE
jgi:CheY-like chemotaxis protein